MLKLSCWFVIPYLALWGTGSLNGLSFPQAVSVIAIVTVLIGVIPTPGNIASIELIYTLLFTVVVGAVSYTHLDVYKRQEHMDTHHS